MSLLLTKGLGGSATDWFLHGMGWLKKIIEEIKKFFGGKIKFWKPKIRKFFEMEIPVRGTVVIKSRITAPIFGTLTQKYTSDIDVTGSLTSKIKTEFAALGTISHPFETSFRSIGTVTIPHSLRINCFGTLVNKVKETFLVSGEKTYNRLIALFTVLDDDDTRSEIR